MTVILTESEIYLAAVVGVRRQIEAIQKGLPDRHGFEGAGWNLHVEGAAGELAVAKAYGRFWDGSVNTFKRSGDVGQVQVRTRSKDGYDLIVRCDDRDEDRFVLVVGRIPEFEVCGWIRGRDAKQDRWLKRHGGREAAYFVPRGALR